jgi:small-conductance mechanosensitive channel
VSGLILLFERPVQVGDVVQMNDASGIVERIGIRASVVRTTSGSEIIVPNGKLISETVVNWTFSSSQRGVQIPVAVAHGANPERVLQILEQVAGAHARVCKTPAPQSLLLRVGPDWLGFELRVWTDAIEKWVQVQSELSLAITSALTRENIALK